MSLKRILIVEDDESVRVLLKLYLMRLNYKLLEAKNGLEGLGVARQFIPDLIITDLTMPVMDGVALVKAIRADEELKEIPIIVLTGTPMDWQQQASDAGADAVINKPVNRRDLIEIIEVIFNGRTSR